MNSIISNNPEAQYAINLLENKEKNKTIVYGKVDYDYSKEGDERDFNKLLTMITNQGKNKVASGPYTAGLDVDYNTGEVRPIAPISAHPAVKGQIKNAADNQSRVSKVALRLRKKAMKKGYVDNLEVNVCNIPRF